MEARLTALEEKLEDYDRVVARLAAVETGLANLNSIKDDFGIKLKDKLAVMEAEAQNKSE